MNLDGCDILFSLHLFRTLPVGEILGCIFFLLFYSTASLPPLKATMERLNPFIQGNGPMIRYATGRSGCIPELRGMESTTILLGAVEETEVEIIEALGRTLADKGWKTTSLIHDE